jgi:NAD-dependent dihydropyrimidine dehydrogenase PreA subunit
MGDDVDDDVKLVRIDGRMIGLVGLERAFEELSAEASSDPQELREELLTRAEADNYIPPGQRDRYGEVIYLEFKRYLKGEREKKPTGMTWRGIPREQIQWYPVVDESNCNGCRKCVSFCAFSVFSYSPSVAVVTVTDPYACVVGCTLCASICEPGVISFPPPVYLDNILKESR